MTEPTPAEAPRRTRWWHHWKMLLTGIVLAPVLVLALYTWAALSFSYSTGDRAGTLQKFSHRGWICKTWEGELMQPTAPGVAPTIWYFTVRNDSVAQIVNGGLGRHVALHYEEHKGVPFSCFGGTRYFVTGMRLTE